MSKVFMTWKNAPIYSPKMSEGSSAVYQKTYQILRMQNSWQDHQDQLRLNYIEANEELSLKDLRMRIKISRKEAKESRLWLSLIKVSDIELLKFQKDLILEAGELLKIFSSIVLKSS